MSLKRLASEALSCYGSRKRPRLDATPQLLAANADDDEAGDEKIHSSTGSALERRTYFRYLKSLLPHPLPCYAQDALSIWVPTACFFTVPDLLDFASSNAKFLRSIMSNPTMPIDECDIPRLKALTFEKVKNMWFPTPCFVHLNDDRKTFTRSAQTALQQCPNVVRVAARLDILNIILSGFERPGLEYEMLPLDKDPDPEWSRFSFVCGVVGRLVIKRAPRNIWDKSLKSFAFKDLTHIAIGVDGPAKFSLNVEKWIDNLPISVQQVVFMTCTTWEHVINAYVHDADQLLNVLVIHMFKDRRVHLLQTPCIEDRFISWSRHNTQNIWDLAVTYTKSEIRRWFTHLSLGYGSQYIIKWAQWMTGTSREVKVSKEDLHELLSMVKTLTFREDKSWTDPSANWRTVEHLKTARKMLSLLEDNLESISLTSLAYSLLQSQIKCPSLVLHADTWPDLRQHTEITHLYLVGCGDPVNLKRLYLPPALTHLAIAISPQYLTDSAYGAFRKICLQRPGLKVFKLVLRIENELVEVPLKQLEDQTPEFFQAAEDRLKPLRNALDASGLAVAVQAGVFDYKIERARLWEST